MKVSKWLIPQLLIFFIMGLKLEITLAFFCIILHELAHYIVAKNIGAKVDNFKIHCLGVTMKIGDYDELNQNEQILICLSGPVFNLLFSIVFLGIYKFYPNEFIFLCIKTNLILGIFNLIPAYPLDGARILVAQLSKIMPHKKARQVAAYISFIVGGIFLVIFLLSIFYTNKIEIMVLIFSIFIIYETYQEKGKAMYIIMADILKKRNILMKKKYIENKIISIYYDQYLLNLLGVIDKNKFHIFYVLDSDMKVIDIIREDELLDALKNYGNITLKEYHSMKHSLK